MTSPTKPLTPRQAYNDARAKEMAKHHYKTEGHVHAICRCGEVGTPESISRHIEELAEAAGVAARDELVKKISAEYEAVERKKKAEAEERMKKARAEVEKEDRERAR